jgi:hypothetical protein
MEKIKTEFDISGQSVIISHDEYKVVIFEQKLGRHNNFIPIENGVYAFFFTKDNPVNAQEMLWEEFEFMYETLVKKNGYKPCFFNYPQWFEKYDEHNIKYQFIYH